MTGGSSCSGSRAVLSRPASTGCGSRKRTSIFRWLIKGTLTLVLAILGGFYGYFVARGTPRFSASKSSLVTHKVAYVYAPSMPTMTLCTLCCTIPFYSIPARPEDSSQLALGDNRDLLQLSWSSNPTLSNKPLGFPWHASLAALAASASSTACPLCQLVQKAAEAWISCFRQEKESKPELFECDKIPYDQQLWLAARASGGDGFVVLVSDPGGTIRVDILTGVALSVPADSPLSQRFPLRPVERESGSERSLDVAAAWLARCVETHDECQSHIVAAVMADNEGTGVGHSDENDTGLPPLPSRILDLGTDQDDSSVIKLIECGGPAGPRGEYACLSHCWGSTVLTKTTRESYKARASGILISDLPKTFRDAVTVSRRLAIRYLWIDSLCIIQDDLDDWAFESSRMTHVYSGAHVVLAANHAKNSSEGCFHDRDRPTTKITIPDVGTVVAQLILPGSENFWSRGFEEEPLSQRGWALQERVLARRVLHFNGGQMYFECNQGIIGEDGYNVQPRYGNGVYSKDVGGLWGHLVWEYGKRKLTKAADKLPAMSGLAKLVEKRTNPGQYVAGLWSNRLTENLAWQGLWNASPASTEEYIGPSWSWVGYGGIAVVALKEDWKDIANVEERHVETKNERNPYGEITDAWIRIRGPLVELKHDEQPTDLEASLLRDDITPLPRMRTSYADMNEERGTRVMTDYIVDQDWSTWKNKVPKHVMLLGSYCNNLKVYGSKADAGGEEKQDKEAQAREENGYKEMSYTEDGHMRFFHGLVLINALARRDSHQPSIKRIGWVTLLSEEGMRITADTENRATITLV